MKKYYLLLIAIICIQATFAQNHKRQDSRKSDSNRPHNYFKTKRHATRNVSSIQNYEVATKLYKLDKQALTGFSAETWVPANSIFINDYKSTFTYDANERAIAHLWNTWDFSTKTWMNESKTEYKYDSKNNITEELSSSWDIVSKLWVFSSKRLNTYDVNNNRTLYEVWDWDIDIKSWIKDYKVESSYDANNRLISSLSSFWNSTKGTYENSDITTIVYDAQGNMVKETNQNWFNGNWENNYKAESTFDSKGNILTESSFRWESNTWAAYYQEIYTYDANNNELSRITQDWDRISKVWVNSSKSENTYDSKSNLTESIYSNWSSNGSGKWVIEEKEEYDYDVSISRSMLVLPIDLDDSEMDLFNYKLLKINSSKWDTLNLVWVNYNNINVEYTPYSTTNNIKPIFSSTISIYPNPANDKVTISIPNYSGNVEAKLFDISGKIIMVNQINSNGFVDVSQLPKGIYSIQLYNNKILLGVRKLVIN